MSLLMTTNPGDAPLLSGLYGEDAPAAIAQMAPEVDPASIEEPCGGDAPKTRLEKRLNALAYSNRELLDAFTMPMWNDVTEGRFTKGAHTAANILAETKTHAESEATLDAATAWSDGLTCGKTFTRLHRLYEKTHSKASRLEEMLVPLRGFVWFLTKTTKRKVAPSLTRLLLQASFRSEAKDFASAAPACKNLVANGLVSSWGASPDEKTKKLPEVWLRTLIHDPIARDLRAIKTTTADDSARLLQLLLEDCWHLHAILTEVSDTEAGRVFRPVAQDMESMRIVLSAWKFDDIDVDVLGPARDRLLSTRMSDLKDALAATDVGTTILGNIAKAMQQSGQDKAGDDKLASALRLLHDASALPFAQEAASAKNEIANFEMLRDPKLVRWLEEGLTMVTEACHLWSRVHRSKKAGDVERALRKLLSIMVFVDKAVTLDMLGHIKCSPAFGYLMDASSDPATWKLPEVRHAFARLQDRLSALPSESQDMRRFVRDVRAAIGKFPSGVAPCEFLQTYEKTYLELIDDHQSMRDLIRTTLFHLCAVMDGDVLGVEEFVAEFHANARGEHLPQPRLTCALQFSHCLQHLPELQFCFDNQPELFDLTVANDPFMPATIEVSIAEMNMFLTAIPVAAGVSMLKSIVDDSATLMCSDALSQSGVSALRSPPTSWKQKSAVDIIACLVDMKRKPGPGTLAATWLKMRSGSPWPGDLAKQIASDIIYDMNNRCMKVDARGLCRPGVSPDAIETENPGQLPAILQVLTDIGKVSSLLGHFHDMITRKVPFTQDAIVQPEINVAILTIQRLLASASNKYTELQLEGDEDVPWVFPLDKVEHWVQIAHHVEVALRRIVITEAVENIKAYAKRVHKDLPPSIEGLFREANFNLKVANENLVEWPSRDQLNQGCNRLWKMLHEVSRVWATWGSGLGLLSDPDWKADLKAAHDVCEDARKALRVIAGVNCLHNLKGQERLDAADAVLKKKEKLPKHLVAALEKLR